MGEETGMIVPESGGMTPIQGDQQLITQIFGGAVSNFDGDATNRMRLEMIAASSKCEKDDKKDGTEFAIRYFYIHRVEKLEPRTGELIPFLRTVIISPSFESLDFGSETVAKSVAIIARNFGGKAWNPAVKVKIRHRKRDGKNDMMDLVPVF